MAKEQSLILKKINVPLKFWFQESLLLVCQERALCLMQCFASHSRTQPDSYRTNQKNVTTAIVNQQRLRCSEIIKINACSKDTVDITIRDLLALVDTF